MDSAKSTNIKLKMFKTPEVFSTFTENPTSVAVS